MGVIYTTTYVLKNATGQKYTGSTGNLHERLKVHNSLAPEKAKFHKTTYNKGPWQIIFMKDFITRAEAQKFERFLKTGTGRKWLRQTL